MKAGILRQAVARIIDSDSIIRDIIKQPALPMPGIVPQWSPFYNRHIPVVQYDPAKAKSTLDQAGYKLDPKTKTRVDPNTGKPLPELKIITDANAMRSQIGRRLADACRSIGLPAKHESIDWNAKYKRVSADDFDLARKMPCVAFVAWFVTDVFRRDGVTGYVDMPGYGAANRDNKWTKLGIRSLRGGAVRWPLLVDPESLNPCSNDYGTGQEVLRWVMDRPIEIDPKTREDVPWIAEEWNVGVWEPAPGRKGTTVAFRIGKDIRWHGGAPFTSDDIKFTIDFLLDTAIDAEQSWLVGNVAKVTAPDPYTVEVYFSDHNYWQMYDINGLWFLPKHIWRDVKDWRSFEPWNEPHPTVSGLTKLIGTGPFIFKEYKPGEFVRLVKNPDYWHLGPAQ